MAISIAPKKGKHFVTSEKRYEIYLRKRTSKTFPKEPFSEDPFKSNHGIRIRDWSDWPDMTGKDEKVVFGLKRGSFSAGDFVASPSLSRDFSNSQDVNRPEFQSVAISANNKSHRS